MNNLLDTQKNEFNDINFLNPSANNKEPFPNLEENDTDINLDDYSDKPNFDVIQSEMDYEENTEDNSLFDSDIDDSYDSDVEDLSQSCTNKIDDIMSDEIEDYDTDYMEDDDYFEEEDSDEYEDLDDYEMYDEDDYDDDIYDDGFMGYESVSELRQAFTEKQPKKKVVKESSDDTAKDELRLYIDNDSKLYSQHTEPMIENIKRKISNGKYDEKKAPKLWAYLVEAGAKKYAKDFAKPSDWNTIFPKDVRNELAEDLASYYYEAIVNGEY